MRQVIEIITFTDYISYHIISYHIKLNSNILHQNKHAYKTQHDTEDMIERPIRPEAIMPLTRVLITNVQNDTLDKKYKQQKNTKY